MSHDKQFYTTFAVVIIGLGVLAIILFFIAGALTKEMSESQSEEVILENISPVGQVYVAGESKPPAAPAPAAPAPATPAAAAGTEVAAAAPRSGEQIYQAKCLACHATGAAGAPKLGDAAAWAPRIAKGADTLLTNAINGINAMPPKGLCMDCSDDDLKAAIEYIVAQSQ